MREVVGLALVAAVSASVTWMVRGYAMRRLVDLPGERRSHSVATPRGGGLGPVVAIALALLAMSRDVAGAQPFVHAVVALLMVAAIGFWDDHRPLSARLRLGVHAAAAVVLGWGLFPPHEAPLAFAITCLGAVALVNIWNFMDGIDGIAASQAALVAAAASVLLVPAFGLVSLAIAVACLAFLPFNFPRARIFMGDVGSGALGLAVAFAWSGLVLEGFAHAALLALPASAFLIDAGLTLARRVIRRERWWEAHTQHLYQALARRHGHRRVTLAYAVWTTAAALLALALPHDPAVIMASLAVWYTTGASLWFMLQRRPQPDAARPMEKDR